MTRYGEEFLINDEAEVWEAIVSYMDDEVREYVHAKLSPCTNEEFLKGYCEMDEEFVLLLRMEFHIELE